MLPAVSPLAELEAKKTEKTRKNLVSKINGLV
jgi:hypothetical protein